MYKYLNDKNLIHEAFYDESLEKTNNLELLIK